MEMVQIWIRESKLEILGDDAAGKGTITISDNAAQVTKTTQMIDMNPRWTAVINRYRMVVT
jgi:hypothetical protein